MASRLKLDFSLSTTEQRKIFLDDYLKNVTFTPTDAELETMGNYLLWGKNPETGKNVVQEKIIQIDSRNKTWDKNQELESWDKIIESPAFNEVIIRKPLEAKWKIPKETFNREKVLAECPASMRNLFTNLFEEIDFLDLQISYWDIAHGKRKEPPRAALLAAFPEEKQLLAQSIAAKWNQFRYLKKRHLLVELRRQQFSLRDCYTTYITKHALPRAEVIEPPPEFTADFQVLPLGTNFECGAFINKLSLNPHLPEENIKLILNSYWKNQNNKKKICFDFRDKNSIYTLIHFLTDLRESVIEFPLVETNNFLKIFDFYLDWAQLTESQKRIFHLKAAGVPNKKIIEIIGNEFDKHYNENYISTIFCQKIVPAIAAAAAEHEQIILSLPFEEDFKTCTCCGKIFLRSIDNFVRRSHSKDGFSTRCKLCDKKEREMKKKK